LGLSPAPLRAQVILTLFAYKLVSPTGMHLTRGNHETKNMNKVYGFEGEVLHKLDGAAMRLFEQCFCCLPLCAVVEQQIFCVHGGLASEVAFNRACCRVHRSVVGATKKKETCGERSSRFQCSPAIVFFLRDTFLNALPR
jgi:hypothetical protein